MSENRNRGRIVYRIVSIFKEKVAKSRLKKKRFQTQSSHYIRWKKKGGFSWIWGEIGRPLVFLRPDLCQRAIETGYEWLVGTGWEAYTRDQNSGRCQSVTMQSLNKLPHLSKTIFYTATMPARTAVMGEGFSAIEKKKCIGRSAIRLSMERKPDIHW